MTAYRLFLCKTVVKRAKKGPRTWTRRKTIKCRIIAHSAAMLEDKIRWAMRQNRGLKPTRLQRIVMRGKTEDIAFPGDIQDALL